MATFLTYVMVVAFVGMLASLLFPFNPTPEAVWREVEALRRFKFFFTIFFLAALVYAVFFDPGLDMIHR